jgi:proteasome lid subunit RPN8/RPN11
MRIRREMYDEMLDHAVQEAPNECCGMIASRDGVGVKLHRMTNAAASPLRYEMDPDEQFRVEYREIYDAGLDVGVIYHSHTRSEPYPSQTDINLASHPESLYVIVGVAGGDRKVRAFTIREGKVEETDLVVEG